VHAAQVRQPTIRCLFRQQLTTPGDGLQMGDLRVLGVGNTRHGMLPKPPNGASLTLSGLTASHQLRLDHVGTAAG
jgi:hypothetical protein